MYLIASLKFTVVSQVLVSHITTLCNLLYRNWHICSRTKSVSPFFADKHDTVRGIFIETGINIEALTSHKKHNNLEKATQNMFWLISTLLTFVFFANYIVIHFISFIFLLPLFFLNFPSCFHFSSYSSSYSNFSYVLFVNSCAEIVQSV